MKGNNKQVELLNRIFEEELSDTSENLDQDLVDLGLDPEELVEKGLKRISDFKKPKRGKLKQFDASEILPVAAKRKKKK